MTHRLVSSFAPPYPASLGRLAEGARADLAARLGLAVEAVTIVGVHAVIWPDGSIGCPRPGMVYTQALVEGALIELQAAGARYSYHSARGRPAFLCEGGAP